MKIIIKIFKTNFNKDLQYFASSSSNGKIVGMEIMK